jgi:hypothetical protein
MFFSPASGRYVSTRVVRVHPHLYVTIHNIAADAVQLAFSLEI